MSPAERLGLQELDFSGNDFSVLSVDEVAFNSFIHSLNECQNVITLDLSNTNINHMATDKFDTLLLNVNALNQLDNVSLANNNFGPDEMSEGNFQAFLRACHRTNEIDVLDVSHTEFGQERIALVASALYHAEIGEVIFNAHHVPAAILPGFLSHGAPAATTSHSVAETSQSSSKPSKP